MRNILLLIFLFTCTPLIQAQHTKTVKQNINGLRPLTSRDWNYLNNLPQLSFSSTKDRLLPTSVDNSTKPYFRPIFNQAGGSCGQASGVAYNFTYEIDFTRNVSAMNGENQYPSHFTWNFLNGGVGSGSWYFDGWAIIDQLGCPDVTTYGGDFATGGDTRWMSGYDNYLNAMHNRMLDVYALDVSTPEGLNTLKQWMTDHGDGSIAGGLANFSAGVSNMQSATLPSGTPHAGKMVVTQWDNPVNHAMTFVGFDDEICYDYNNDGQYTNDIDLNNDGIIDMRDWEKGGLIVANSWGTWWGDEGKSYMMYRLLAESVANGGIWHGTVHVIRCKTSYQPLITAKATIKHTSRGKLRITAGVSTNLQATQPDHILNLQVFNYQGGNHYMQGGLSNDDKTMELGLDLTPLLSYVEPNEEAKYFLFIAEQDADNQYDGTIESFAIIDYTQNGMEINCTQTPLAMLNNDTTLATVSHALYFDKVNITTSSLPQATVTTPYQQLLAATSGISPYQWNLVIGYEEQHIVGDFPDTDQSLTPYDNDDGFATLDIDFDFPFYGELYNHLVITTDGGILFTEDFEYVRNPNNLMGNKAITPYGADLMLYPAQGDGIWYSTTENSVSIHWKASAYDNPGFNAEFATTLYADGTIQYFYSNNITPTSDWVSGVSNGDHNSYTLCALSGVNQLPQDEATELMCEGFPQGMNLSEDGVFSGTPVQSGKTWNITFKVTDANRISSLRTLPFNTAGAITMMPDTIRFNTIEQCQNGLTFHFENTTEEDITITQLKESGSLQSAQWFIAEPTNINLPLIVPSGSDIDFKIGVNLVLNTPSDLIYDLITLQTNSGSELSGVITINPGLLTQIEEIGFSKTNPVGKIYPNPCQESFTIPLYLDESHHLKITIQALDGRIIMQHDYGMIQPGVNFIENNINSCQPGIYLATIYLDEATITKRIIRSR